jgi:hypothetical protein
VGTAILRLLPWSELGHLAAVATSDDFIAQRLKILCKHDVALSLVMDRLQAWLPNRELSPHIVLGSDHDWLGIRPPHSMPNPSLGLSLITTFRAAVEPRRELCFVASARNEGIYFVEWIAHHRMLGVEHFFIFSNDNDDGSDALLRSLAENGLITWIDNKVGPGVRPMQKAFTYAFTLFPETLDFQWTMIVDLDEFVVLNPDRHKSLRDLLRLRQADDASCVAFHWLMYVPGEDLDWSTAPMIQRFRFREPVENRHIKSAFQTRHVVSSMPHDPTFRPGFKALYQTPAGARHHWDGKGSPPSEGDPEYSDAWINHYFFKSVEEVIWKRSRGGGDGVGAGPLRFEPHELHGHLGWRGLNQATEDLRGMHHVPALEAEAARIRSLPGVQDAEDAVRKIFRQRVRKLKDDALLALQQQPQIDARLASAYANLLR